MLVGIGNLTKNGRNFIKVREKNGGYDLCQRKSETELTIKLKCKYERWNKSFEDVKMKS